MLLYLIIFQILIKTKKRYGWIRTSVLSGIVGECSIFELHIFGIFGIFGIFWGLGQLESNVIVFNRDMEGPDGLGNSRVAPLVSRRRRARHTDGFCNR
jgi:hypothetical protein